MTILLPNKHHKTKITCYCNTVFSEVILNPWVNELSGSGWVVTNLSNQMLDLAEVGVTETFHKQGLSGSCL